VDDQADHDRDADRDGLRVVPVGQIDRYRPATDLVRDRRRAGAVQGVTTADLGFLGVVLSEDRDLDGYLDGTLGPLWAYDAARGARLVQTLDAYFAADRSPAGPGTPCTYTRTRCTSGWTGSPNCSGPTGAPRPGHGNSSSHSPCTAPGTPRPPADRDLVTAGSGHPPPVRGRPGASGPRCG
jgi:hypothetical protein